MLAGLNDRLLLFELPQQGVHLGSVRPHDVALVGVRQQRPAICTEEVEAIRLHRLPIASR
ncbi:hypothetical protein MAXJ12_26258 [Mesorhizobium alhagi CCNWXJ12-2]|uniref:Uncharacterized protein n=1 Tax=Mesorhizobium alhagi CCNWXJ12-2 TaxID=1107882 RepID=H0HYH1_9HYPH|nr:hypothetical protein MAXJ12_26258 [Mesorhizobium alhagi CCNWXJ12-2]